MSGARATTSSGSAMMRSRPIGACARSGKMSSPPAMPISSLTQRIADIGGSSHSSKYTRGRRGSRAAASATRSRPVCSCSTYPRARSSAPTIAPSRRT